MRLAHSLALALSLAACKRVAPAATTTRPAANVVAVPDVAAPAGPIAPPQLPATTEASLPLAQGAPRLLLTAEHLRIDAAPWLATLSAEQRAAVRLESATLELSDGEFRADDLQNDNGVVIPALVRQSIALRAAMRATGATLPLDLFIDAEVSSRAVVQALLSLRRASMPVAFALRRGDSDVRYALRDPTATADCLRLHLHLKRERMWFRYESASDEARQEPSRDDAGARRGVAWREVDEVAALPVLQAAAAELGRALALCRYTVVSATKDVRWRSLAATLLRVEYPWQLGPVELQAGRSPLRSGDR